MQKTVCTAGCLELWSESRGDPADPAVLLIAGANASVMGRPEEFGALLVQRGLRVLRYDHRDTGRCHARHTPLFVAGHGW